MTTITKLEQQFKDGKPSGYKVNLANGTFGYLNEKESDKGLKEGDAVTFTAVTPDGKSYKKLTLKKAQGASEAQPVSNNSPKASNPLPINAGQIKVLKADASIKALEFVMDAFKSERIDWTQVREKQAECANILWDEIDAIFTDKI